MPAAQWSNGVVLKANAGDTVTLRMPKELLAQLQAAWQADDKQGTNYSPIVEAVRDLFLGEDGQLVVLADAGISTRTV